jgi:hypothetical protein
MYFVLNVCRGRVGDGMVPLAIVIYIDRSFVKHKIPVKPIYITVRNLNSTVSGKLEAGAWRVLGMMPNLQKSATLAQTETLRKERRLRLHIMHALSVWSRWWTNLALKTSTLSVQMVRCDV